MAFYTAKKFIEILKINLFLRFLFYNESVKDFVVYGLSTNQKPRGVYL